MTEPKKVLAFMILLDEGPYSIQTWYFFTFFLFYILLIERRSSNHTPNGKHLGMAKLYFITLSEQDLAMTSAPQCMGANGNCIV
jgi:hypothetical protein